MIHVEGEVMQGQCDASTMYKVKRPNKLNPNTCPTFYGCAHSYVSNAVPVSEKAGSKGLGTMWEKETNQGQRDWKANSTTARGLATSGPLL